MIKLAPILVLLFSINLFADWSIEKRKIDFLIHEVSKVDGVFIRNGSEHTPKEASKHLRMKLNNALSSWFTPSKEKWTAELFIEKVASKSSLSGKAYQIKLKTGKVIESKQWFLNKLKHFKQ